MKKILGLIVMITGISVISANDFGSKGALADKRFNLEEMLAYAIQDEYLALHEYEAILREFGNQRPYSNIIDSEKNHISYLMELYDEYGFKLPDRDTFKYVAVPDSLAEAAEIGVEAEINNIAMYEKFLKENLPADIRDVFILLKEASENHLKAFQRQTENNKLGRGRNKKS